MIKELQIENKIISRLSDLKYTYRNDIRNRDTLEQNFRKEFEVINRVNLTDSEFERLREEIVKPDVFTTAKYLRERNYFQREDGTPLHYTLVNIKDWCKNDYEVINQLRINTENSHHRYDVILLYTNLKDEQIETIENLLPTDELHSFKSVYLDTAKRLLDLGMESPY